MPGPVSDSYDPEWGTAANGQEIKDALNEVYQRVSGVLRADPIYVLDLVHANLPELISATLTERDWRLIRFALERAGDSI